MNTKQQQRRHKGEGSVYQDSATGRWVGLVDVTDRAASNRAPRVRRKVTGKTKTEVVKRMREIRAAHEAGLDVARQSPTVAELARQWLDERAPRRNQESTMIRLRDRIERHLIPGVGAILVDRLTVADVERWLKAEVASGHAKRTVQDYLSDLRRVLEWAHGRDQVRKNVAKHADVPIDARESTEKRSLTEDQLAALYGALEVARVLKTGKVLSDRLGPYFVILAEMGLRPQEADALRWCDVDLDERVLHVRQAMKRGEGGAPLGVGAPKTERSTRSLRLSVDAVAALRRRSIEQKNERMKAGPAWTTDERWSGLVFTSEVGTPLLPRNARRSLLAACERAGIPAFSVYELRHTAASLMIHAGASAFDTADQLGHVDTRMLDRHYRHRVVRVIDTAAVVADQRRAAR